MPPKRSFFASILSERAFLAALLSVGLAWLAKDGLTSLLFDGKSFAGRGLTVQAALLSILFLLIFALLMLILPGLLDRLLQGARIPLVALSLVPLAAHAWMGSYSRFVSDDFSSAALAVKYGVWGAAVDWYLHWTGRFSANLVDSLTGALGPRALAFQTAAVLILFITGLTLAVGFLLKKQNRRWPAAVFLAALILNAAFQVAPDLPQSLYWAQGMHSLILPLALGAFLAVALLRLRQHPEPSRSARAAWAAATGLLAFIAGGFGETYVSIQTLLLALLLAAGLVCRWEDFRKKLLPASAASLAGSLLAAAVIILSPGNATRQAEFPPTPALPAMLWIAFRAFSDYLGVLISSPIKIWHLASLFAAAFLAGSGFVFGAGVEPRSTLGEKKGFILLAVLAGTLAMVYACFVPSAFGMSSAPPGRTLAIPSFLIAAGTGLAGFIGGGAFHGPLQKVKARRPDAAHLLAWVLFLVFTAQIFFTTRGILTLQPEYSHFARVADAADEIIRQAKMEGRDSVEIPEVHNHFGLSDFGAGTNSWLDDAVNQYYGIRVVINKNLNKHYK